MQPKSPWDWFGVFCLWFGAAIFAIRQADFSLVPGAPRIFASGVWNFVPIALISVALATFIYRQLSSGRATTESAPRAPVAGRWASSISAPQETAPSQPTGGVPERVFVSDGLTPRKIMSMCEGKTSHQAERAIKPFIGHWIRVSGIVADFYMLSDEWGAVLLQSALMPGLPGIELREVHSAKLFFRSGFDRLQMLQGGEHIVADGQIKEVDSLSFKADYCEIVSIGPAEG